MKEIKRYFSYLGKRSVPYWSIFAATILFSAALEILYSYMNKLIFHAVEYRENPLFFQACLLSLLLVVLSCIQPYFRYFQIRLVRKTVFDIKIAMFEKLMTLNMKYFENHHSGEALKTLNTDANSLKDSYFSHVYWVISAVTNGIAAMGMMFVYHAKLAVISILFSAVTVRISLWVNGRMKQSEKKIQENVRKLSERLSDILSEFVIFKMYRGAFIVVDQYMQENDSVQREMNKRTKQAAFLEMSSFFWGIMGSLGTIMAGTLLAGRKELDYGVIMAIVSLQMSVSHSFQRLGSSITTFSASLVKAGHVFDFLELDCAEKAGEKDKLPDLGQTPLLIKDLQFSYHDVAGVLKNFSLTAEKGEKIVLTGESGCGKSTLLKLLMRFYEASAGTIKLYGRELDSYELQTLRSLITYVPQTSYLFEGTVKENIAFGYQGTGNITEEEIQKAALMAYADEFIRELPQGYDTRMTAGGRNLSGGQRQRIAIARAFLRNTPILLLDEPSSALDTDSEQKINFAIEQLMKDKTVLLVTHRSAVIADFHKRVEM